MSRQIIWNTTLMIYVIVICMSGVGCSVEHPYHNAVELIKQMKYEEAIAELNKVPLGDSLASKTATAMQICRIGMLYQQAEYAEALHLIDSTQQMGDSRIYVLNLNPNDTLYSHTAVLAVLTVCRMSMDFVDEFLSAPVSSDTYYHYAGDGYFAQTVEGVLPSSDTDHRPEYNEIDEYYEESGVYVSIPFIRSISLAELWLPPEWEDEAVPMRKKILELSKKVKDRWVALESKDEEEQESRRLAEEQALAFTSENDAMNWLCRGSGIWVQAGTIHHKRRGIDIKMAQIFKSKGYAGGYSVSVATVDAETYKDVMERANYDTWVVELEGNRVKCALGSKWSTSDMTRTGDDSMMLKGIGAMRRQ